MNNIFYTYIYLDPRKPGSFDYGEFHFDFEPFYVGKGCRNQWSSHLKLAEIKIYKSYKVNKIRKIQSLGLEPKIIKYKENLTEQEVFDLEKKLIKAIGRLDLGHGPLTNLTDGGEGLSGAIRSKETRQKMAEKKRGRTKENDPSVVRAAEKRSIALTGRTAATDSGIARMAEKLRGRTKETDPSIARRAEKLRGGTSWNRGLTKETNLCMAGQAEKRKGRTKETDPGVARQTEKIRGNECGAKTWNIVFKNGTKQTIKNLAKFCRETGFKVGKDFKSEVQL